MMNSTLTDFFSSDSWFDHALLKFIHFLHVILFRVRKKEILFIRYNLNTSRNKLYTLQYFNTEPIDIILPHEVLSSTHEVTQAHIFGMCMYSESIREFSGGGIKMKQSHFTNHQLKLRTTECRASFLPLSLFFFFLV